MIEREKSNYHFNELDYYYNLIKKNKPLTTEEEHELFIKFKQGDHQAYEKLIKSNLRYVFYYAKNYVWSGLPINDLISEGNFGLIHAIEKFDPDRGTKLITYAKNWIKQTIEMYIFKNSVVNKIENDDFKIYKEKEVSEENTNDDIYKNQMVDFVLNFLNKLEYIVITKHYGLKGEKEKKLNEIGDEIGLSPEYIRKIKEKAIKKIRFFFLYKNFLNE